jgi:hypothetical protein
MQVAESEGPSGRSADEGAEDGSSLGKMLRARKAAGGARSPRASGAAARDGEAGGPPPLRPLDPRVIQERRRRNPRDQPSQLDDPDYG